MSKSNVKNSETSATALSDGIKRKYIKFNRVPLSDVISSLGLIEFDGHTPMLGRDIEAWSISNFYSTDTEAAILAKMIIDTYFFGRYPELTESEPREEQERGYNLNGNAYYAVKVIRSQMIDHATGIGAVIKIKIFRDYDLSPRTFAYPTDPSPKED